jgi:hypothetical protein
VYDPPDTAVLLVRRRAAELKSRPGAFLISRSRIGIRRVPIAFASRVADAFPSRSRRAWDDQERPEGMSRPHRGERLVAGMTEGSAVGTRAQLLSQLSGRASLRGSVALCRVAISGRRCTDDAPACRDRRAHPFGDRPVEGSRVAITVSTFRVPRVVRTPQVSVTCDPSGS